MRTIGDLPIAERKLLEKHRKWVEDGMLLKRPSLSGLDLSNTDLRGVCLYRANLSFADLSKAYLERADLRGAELYNANLANVWAYRTNLTNAYLAEACLVRACMTAIELKGANLVRANLSHADLEEANLYAVDLRNANLYRANWEYAKNGLTFGPIGSRLGLTYAVRHPKAVMIKCGCFWGTLEEWEAQCRRVHRGTVHAEAYAAATAFIRAYANSYWTGEEVEDV